MQRILVIRLSSMGDVLLTTPVLRALKHGYPDAEIDFIVKETFAPLIRTNPNVSRVLAFAPGGGLQELRRAAGRIRGSGYDGIADLHTNLRSRWMTALSGCRRIVRYRNRRWARFLLVRFGRDAYGDDVPVPLRYLEAMEPWDVEDDGGGLELVPDPESRAAMDARLREAGGSPEKRRIVLAPGASRATKRWMPERFARVGDHFAGLGYGVVLVGGGEDGPVGRRVAETMERSVMDLTGRTSLMETAALIEGASLLVTHDTGVMHMGTALQTPVLALFGPTTRRLGFFPFRAHAVVVEKTMSCRPCSYHGSERCPKGHFRCMREITESEVIQAAEHLLDGE